MHFQDNMYLFSAADTLYARLLRDSHLDLEIETLKENSHLILILKLSKIWDIYIKFSWFLWLFF